MTSNPKYAEFARSLADLFLDRDYAHDHGHVTSNSLLGLVYTYELTGDRKYLNAAIRGAEVLLQNEQASMAFMGGLGNYFYSEGCGISDWFYLNMVLGRATGKAAYFDKAERILWAPFLHHMRPNGGMGNDNVNPADGLLQMAHYEAPGCCTMWAPNGLVRALAFAAMGDDDGLVVPLYYPFTASTKSPSVGSVKLSMLTSYPESGSIRIRLDSCQSGKRWRLKLRVPTWSSISSLSVNGSEFRVDDKNGWIEIKRPWMSGDVVSFEIPMKVWLSRPISDDTLEIPEGSSDVVLKGVRLFRGPMLLGVDKQRNPSLDWEQGKPFTLYLPSRKGGLGALPVSTSSGGMDPRLIYPKAHLKSVVGLGSLDALDPDQMKGVVLTPIAECPGRTANTPKEIENITLANREAVLFDVVIAKTEHCRQAISRAVRR